MDATTTVFSQLAGHLTHGEAAALVRTLFAGCLALINEHMDEIPTDTGPISASEAHVVKLSRSAEVIAYEHAYGIASEGVVHREHYERWALLVALARATHAILSNPGTSGKQHTDSCVCARHLCETALRATAVMQSAPAQAREATGACEEVGA